MRPQSKRNIKESKVVNYLRMENNFYLFFIKSNKYNGYINILNISHKTILKELTRNK